MARCEDRYTLDSASLKSAPNTVIYQSNAGNGYRSGSLDNGASNLYHNEVLEVLPERADLYGSIGFQDEVKKQYNTDSDVSKR